MSVVTRFAVFLSRNHWIGLTLWAVAQFTLGWLIAHKRKIVYDGNVLLDVSKTFTGDQLYQYHVYSAYGAFAFAAVLFLAKLILVGANYTNLFSSRRSTNFFVSRTVGAHFFGLSALFAVQYATMEYTAQLTAVTGLDKAQLHTVHLCSGASILAYTLVLFFEKFTLGGSAAVKVKKTN